MVRRQEVGEQRSERDFLVISGKKIHKKQGTTKRKREEGN